MKKTPIVVPQFFKGIALFTPGGDLIYCLDSTKQNRWHLQLCTALQEIFSLPEPPHFLVPGYTATVDRWFDAYSQQVKTVGEIYPAVKRYEPLLNAIFDTDRLIWKTVAWQEEFCNPIILEAYRDRFPQLWEDRDLIVRLENSDYSTRPSVQSLLEDSPEKNYGYVLRLFVSGDSAATEKALESIHQLLEKEFPYPYTLKVIDISKHPEQAEIHQILATPTLLRVFPQPIRRIVGELEDLQRLLQIVTS